MAAVASPVQRGIQLSKVSPAFLHANSTSHTWAFSAFAELIDNAYDPDVSASELLIDKLEINGQTCLIFLDNGAGMDTDKLLKMLSFGFCDKQMYERTLSHLPIGHYGNGFKSGSMRLGKDALVFTRCHNSASIGFLSQTYLKAIEADSVFIPIVTYRLPKLERIKSEQSRNNLNAILKHSVFRTEQDLKEELYALEGSMTGTKIIMSNLKRLQDGRLELDFSSDETDIRCPEAHEVDLTSVYHRPVQLPTSEYKHSLREYCSILFLRPRMKITIRGSRVKSRLISKSLSNTEIDSYKPTWLSRPLKITFGFICQKTKTEDYGMMLYHRNRLIKAFEKVGYQKQPNDLGIGVVGVAQVDFLQPTHNKQDFNKDEKFNSVMMAFANKLNDYWNEKKQNTPAFPNEDSTQTSLRDAPDWTWAQCEICLKWRRMPDGIDKDSLPDQWFCRFNPDATHNRCEIPEEPEDEDLAVKPTYVKTFKRKREEKKRQEMMTRQRQDIERQMLQARPHPPEGLPVFNNLQKALAEAKQREEEHRQVILKMQEEKKQLELQLAESSVQSKLKKRHQNVTPDINSPLNKRKGDPIQMDSPRSSKMTKQDQYANLNNNNSNNMNTNTPIRPPSGSGGKNASKSNSASTPSLSSTLKVKIGGLLTKNNKSNQQGDNVKKSKKATSSQSKNDNETFVDLTEDMDYEITLNEDYDSDEDVKPDLSELSSSVQRKEKAKEKQKGKDKEEEADVKPDKSLLDKLSKEKSATPNKQPPSGNKVAFSDIKEELQGKESPVKTVTDKTPVTPPSADPTDNTNDDHDPPGFDAPENDNDDDEMRPEDRLSSNVDKVMAALENKFKKSLSKKKKTTDHENQGDKQCANVEGENRVLEEEKENAGSSNAGGKHKDSDGKEKESEIIQKEIEHIETEPVNAQEDRGKNGDGDVIEICSGDEDNEDGFDWGGVVIKKEVESDQTNIKDDQGSSSKVSDGDDPDNGTQPFEVTGKELEDGASGRKSNKDDQESSSKASDGDDPDNGTQPFEVTGKELEDGASGRKSNMEKNHSGSDDGAETETQPFEVTEMGSEDVACSELSNKENKCAGHADIETRSSDAKEKKSEGVTNCEKSNKEKISVSSKDDADTETQPYEPMETESDQVVSFVNSYDKESESDDKNSTKIMDQGEVGEEEESQSLLPCQDRGIVSYSDDDNDDVSHKCSEAGKTEGGKLIHHNDDGANNSKDIDGQKALVSDSLCNIKTVNNGDNDANDNFSDGSKEVLQRSVVSEQGDVDEMVNNDCTVDRANDKSTEKDEDKHDNDVNSSEKDSTAGCDSNKKKGNANKDSVEKIHKEVDTVEDDASLGGKDSDSEGKSNVAEDSRRCQLNSSADIGDKNDDSDDCEDFDDDFCHDVPNDDILDKRNSISSVDDKGDNAEGGDGRNNRNAISKLRFQKNVHHLLSLLCPDADLGDVSDIEQTVQTMIQIHQESSQTQSITSEPEIS